MRQNERKDSLEQNVYEWPAEGKKWEEKSITRNESGVGKNREIVHVCMCCRSVKERPKTKNDCED